MRIINKRVKNPFIRIFILVIVIAFASYLVLSNLKKASAEWFDASWFYRYAANISNSGSAQTDYQIAITLDTATLITANKMQSDCDDIRVTDANGKQLPYWLQKNGGTGGGACNTSNTQIWTKVPSIPTSGQTVYIYYGNPNATNAENGKNVFEMFDDFEDGNYASNPAWTVENGTWTTETQAFAHGTYVTKLATSSDDQRLVRGSYSSSIFEADIYHTSFSGSGCGIYVEGIDEYGIFSSTTMGYHGGTYASPFTFSTSTWYKLTYNGLTGIAYVNDTQSRDYGVTGSGSREFKLDCGTADGSNPVYYDDIRVRKAVSTPPTIGSSGSEEKGPAPVAYWRFDEGQGNTTYDDSTNNNDGTRGGGTAGYMPTWVTEDQCVAGKCLQFDGTDDYVTLGSGASITSRITNGLTAEAWVKPKTAAGSSAYQNAVSQYGGGSNGWILRTSDNNNGHFYPHVYIGSSWYNCDGGLLSTNQWSHIVLTYDGETMNAYVNGNYVCQNTSPSGNLAMTGPTIVGGNSGGEFFAGFVDDVKIYNYVRTAAQIKTDYSSRGSTSGVSAKVGNESSWLSNGLVGYWKMDEASWNGTAGEVVDSSGAGNNGVRAADATTAAGKFGNGGTFDGTGDKATVSSASNLPTGTGSRTLAFWFKRTADQDQIIAEYGTRSTGQAFSIYVSSGGGNVSFGGWGADVSFGLTSTVNVWNHAVATFDGTTIRTYLNGVAGGTGTPSLNTTGTDVIVGGGSSGGYTGSVDELRIYNRVLSSKEIADLYNFAPGPWAYYKLDEKSGTTANDSSGNGNASVWSGLTASDWTTGKYGSALQFNNSDYLRVSVDSWIRKAQDITISGWYYHTGDTNGGPWGIITDSTGGTEDGFWMHTKYSGGEFFLRTEDSTYGESDGTGTAFVSSGNWYYITTIVGTNKFNVYVNGVLNWAWTPNANFAWANINSDTAYLYIGKSYATEVSANAKIDDVRIYNYARTQKQILEDMNAGHPSVGSPVGSYAGYWKLDEGYGSNTYDQSVNANTGTITGATWTNNGKFGKALIFDGSDDYINMGNGASLGLTDELTYSAWVKYNSFSDANPAIISHYWRPVLWRYNVSSGVFQFTDDEGGGNTWNAVGTTVVQLNQWYHVVGTFSKSEGLMKIYVNGKLEGQVAKTTSINLSGVQPVTVGCTYVGCTGDRTNGTIDEVKVYPFALTASDILTEYNQGKALKMGSLSDTSGLTGGSVASNSASALFCVPGDTATCTAPVGEWSFNEKSGSSAYDSSGNGYTGTITGATWTLGKYGSGLNFDGTDDKVEVGAAKFDSLTAATTEFWFKYTGTFDENRVLFSRYKDGSNRMPIFIASSNSKITYENIVGASNRDVVSDSAISANTWYHATFTCGTGGMKMYVNGVLQADTDATTDCFSAIAATASNSFGTHSSSAYFKGIVDDVKVFDYVRTPAQIAWDYNRGKPVGHWRFDECQGLTANDSSGNSNTGTVTIGASGTQTSAGTCAVNATTAWYGGLSGKMNSAIKLDGTDDLITVNDASNIDITSGDITVALWAKPAALGSSMDIVEKGGGPCGGYLLYLKSSNKFAFIKQCDSASDVTSTTTPEVNNWYHVVGTKVGATAKIYVNGVLEATDTSFADFADVGNLWIGDGQDAAFNGLIDDVKIFNYALTPAQIRLDYNQGSAVRFGPTTGRP